MVSAEVKNDFKTLFLFFNTIVMLLPGLFLVSAAVAVLTSYHMVHQYIVGISGIVFGAGFTILSISVLGYCATIMNSKIMLCIYAGVMTLIAVADVVGIVLCYGTMEVMLPLLVTLSVVLVILVLTVVLLAIPAGKDRAQGVVLSLATTTNTHF